MLKIFNLKFSWWKIWELHLYIGWKSESVIENAPFSFIHDLDFNYFSTKWIILFLILFVYDVRLSLNPIWPRGESIWPPYRLIAITEKVFELESSNFLAFLTNTSPHLRLKAGLLYLLPESSRILPKCLILPVPD